MSHNQTMSSFSGSKRDARSSRLKRSTHRFLKGGGFCRNRESIRRARPSRVFGLVRGVLLSPWLLALVCFWTGGGNVSVSQAAEAGGVVRVEQIYDADGQRVGKRVVTLDPDTGLSHTNEQRFLLEGLNPTGYAQVSGVIGRESGQGWRVTQRSLHGQGLVGTATRRSEAVPGQAGGWQIRHAMADGHGSVRQELEEEALGPPRIYTAWGEDVGVGGLRDDVGMGWGYAGEVWDGALGMYELRARQYRPTTGRFWTMDRFEGRSREPLSLHKYLYASADPVNRVDPSGNEVEHAARDMDGVFIGRHHFLILIPDRPADFEGNSPGAKLLQALGIRMETIGGKQMIVAGAHNVTGRLQVKFFQVADKTATRELHDSSYELPFWSDFDAEGHVIAAPSGKTDTQFITEILQTVQSYIGNENVSNIQYPKAGMFKGKYNSNSWASSVLQHVGATPWPDFNGVDPLSAARIPNDYFKAGGVRPGTSPRPGSRLNISDTITLPVIVLP